MPSTRATTSATARCLIGHACSGRGGSRKPRRAPSYPRPGACSEQPMECGSHVVDHGLADLESDVALDAGVSLDASPCGREGRADPATWEARPIVRALSTSLPSAATTTFFFPTSLLCLGRY